VAIIMDGNGRWARARGRPRLEGHRRGGEAVRRIVEAAPEAGITTLTLYAFSTDNWHRPRDEVDGLMELFEAHLRREWRRCARNGVRLSVIGRRDRLAPRLRRAIALAEERTAGGSRLHLRLAVDYSARESILGAADLARSEPALDPPTFSRLINRALHSEPAASDVDLLIRTSGERRLSDFLLWECAYAELVFTERFWPDFDREALGAAVQEFRRRNRRFGRLPGPAAGSGAP
jgi:undecaprenyl diphosphate synthase